MNSKFLKTLLLSFVASPFFLAYSTSETDEAKEEVAEKTEVVEKATDSSEKVQAKQSDSTIALVKEITTKANLGVNQKKASKDESMKFFKETLQKVIENNKDLRKMRCEVSAAMGANNYARGEFLPSVDLVAGYDLKRSFADTKKYNSADVQTGSSDDKTNSWGGSAGVELKYNLFNGFGSVSQLKIANNETRAKYEEYKAAEGQKIYEVFQALLRIVTSKILIDQHTANVKIHESMLNEAVQKMKVGEVDRTTVTYAEQKYALAIAKLEATKIKYEGLLSDFELWTGISAESVIAAHPDFAKFLPEALEEMKKIAEKENSKILSGKYAALAKKASVNKQLSGYSPRLDLTASAKMVDSNGRKFNKPNGSSDYVKGDKEENDISNYSTGIQLSIPLDVKGTTRTNVTGARHDYVKTQIAGQQTYDQVMSDLETDFGRLKREKSMVEAYERQVKASEINLQCNLQELAVGAAVYTQTLKAQADLLDANAALFEARQNVSDTELRLIKSIGRLNGKVLGAENVLDFNPFKKAPCKACSFKKDVEKKEEVKAPVANKNDAVVVKTNDVKATPSKAIMKPIVETRKVKKPVATKKS